MQFDYENEIPGIRRLTSKVVSSLVNQIIPHIQLLGSIGRKERINLFHACMDHVFRSFGSLKTYTKRDFSFTEDPDQERLGEIISRFSEKGFDFISIHWWDPISLLRSSILSHFNDSSVLIKKFSAEDELLSVYRRIERIYLKLNSQEPAGMTFVNALAKSSVLNNRLDSITVLLWPNNIDIPTSEVIKETEHGKATDNLITGRLHILKYPSHSMTKIFTRQNLGKVLDKAIRPEFADEMVDTVVNELMKPPEELAANSLRVKQVPSRELAIVCPQESTNRMNQ